MNRKQNYRMGILSAICMLIMILDSKTALTGAASGIEMCIKTVIPALFPFFFLTNIVTRTLCQPLGRIFRPIGRLCKIPAGSESAFMLGLLGGYPIGAQAVYINYTAGNIDKENARRMLTFCNNPGPAFIFGMVGCMFDSVIVPWVIWSIIIIGALLTAWIQPSCNSIPCNTVSQNSAGILETAIKAIAKVCSWVIIFRVFLTVLNRWILWILPAKITICITGLLELTNGCTSLLDTNDIVFRFCTVSAMLSFGGVCVTMQTIGVAGSLINRNYFLGKLFQMFLALPLSYIASVFLFSQAITFTGIIIAALSLFVAIMIGCFLYKNNTGNIHAYDI